MTSKEILAALGQAGCTIVQRPVAAAVIEAPSSAICSKGTDAVPLDLSSISDEACEDLEFTLDNTAEANADIKVFFGPRGIRNARNYWAPDFTAPSTPAAVSATDTGSVVSDESGTPALCLGYFNYQSQNGVVLNGFTVEVTTTPVGGNPQTQLGQKAHTIKYDLTCEDKATRVKLPSLCSVCPDDDDNVKAFGGIYPLDDFNALEYTLKAGFAISIRLGLVGSGKAKLIVPCFNGDTFVSQQAVIVK